MNGGVKRLVGSGAFSRPEPYTDLEFMVKNFGTVGMEFLSL